MATTLTRAQLARHATFDPPRFLGNGKGRRPAIAIASLVLTTLCMAVFASLYVHAGNRVAVLIVARDVPQGRAITAHDLAVEQISFSPGLSPIPAYDLSRVVGRRATVPLLPGTLLSRQELAARNGLPAGQAVVGIAMKAGALPAGGVADGDTVEVVLTGSPGALGPGSSAGLAPPSTTPGGGPVVAGGVLAENATVTEVVAPTSTNSYTTIVSILVPSTLAPLVATASAAGQVALVLVGASS